MTVLQVWIDETLIGTLTQNLDCTETFEFASAYLELPPIECLVLGQLFEDRLPNANHVGGPIGWFDHLLPQGALRKWQASNLDVSENDSFELLAALGDDLPGAVRLRPPAHPTDPRSPPFNSDQSRKKSTDLRLKFSLAGMQWKLSARSSASGLTVRGSDGDQAVIVKFEAPGYLQIPRVEADQTLQECSASQTAP